MLKIRNLTRLLEAGGGPGAGGGGLKHLVRTASTSQSERQAHAVNLEVERTEPRPTSEIPGPPIFPGLGSIPSMMLYKEFRQGKMHEAFYRMIDQYGPIVKFKVPNWPQGVLLTRPEDKETVLRSTQDNPIRNALSSLKKVRELTEGNFFENGGGVLIEQGEEWWRVRKSVQTPMMKFKNVEAYLGQMDEVALQFTDRIAALQKEHGQMPENFSLEMYKWAMESVCVVALSRRLGCLDPDLAPDSEQVKMIKIIGTLFDTLHDCEFTGPVWSIYPTPTFRKLQRMHQELLDMAVKNIIKTEEGLKEALSKPEAEQRELTLIEQLLMKPDLTRKDVVTIIMDLIFGGTDTTANTLSFVFYLLSKNPEAQAKLQEEVDRVLKDDPRPLTASHLAKLPYTKAVLKETLRVFPVAIAILRELTEDTVLSGYTVPKGNCVMLMNYEYNNEGSSFPRHDEFLPERWFRGSDLGSSSPFALLSFGHGMRMCLGRRIAEQEMYTLLARIMQRFTVSYHHGEIESLMRMSLIPNKPWQFSFTERKK